ncbi:MAG: hypothetical protein RLZZ568_1599 [Cyanobacteriota bacterium]
MSLLTQSPSPTPPTPQETLAPSPPKEDVDVSSLSRQGKSLSDWIDQILNFVKGKPAEKINRQLQDRYHGLMSAEEQENTINMAENAQLMKQLINGEKLDVDAIKADESTEALNQQLAMTQKLSDQLAGVDPVATVGAETLETEGNTNIASPFVFGGGILGLVALLWWLKSLSVWSHLSKKIIGEEGLYQAVLGILGQAKPRVSASDLFLYNKAFQDIEKIAQQAISINSDKFSQSEFVLFAKVQYGFNDPSGNYRELQPYLGRLKSAFKAKRIYTTLNQFEMGCVGIKQQIFYDYCHQLLQQNLRGDALTTQVTAKLTELIPLVKTDTGKANLTTYAEVINRLALDPMAIAMINDFKAEKAGYYTAVKAIVDVMERLQEADVSDLHAIMQATMANYDDFDVLADSIDLPAAKRSPDTYARLLQYLALEKRHQLSFIQFQGLVDVLRQWHKPFRVLMDIRQQYPAKQFRQPAVFTLPIPGLSLYQKHRNSLTDQRTGRSLILFDDEADSLNTIG